MSESNPSFFPVNLPDWNFVQEEFPFPLAITCSRLQEEMARQEPIAAAWQLRDAFECLIKFAASLALADFLHAQLDPLAAGGIAQLLLKPSGLSLGDWHSLLEMALKPYSAGELDGGGSSGNGRILPELVPVFFETQGRVRPTALNKKIDGIPDSFVAWRNRVFGHGVFSQDRGYYARETLAWLPVLGDFYAALRPVLAGRRLVSRTPGGEEVIWQGAGDLPPVSRHEHEPWGNPLPMFLAPVPGLDLPTLPLTPLLSMQQCRSCNQPAAFFFDKNKYDRKQDRHSTTFLEYFNGHPATHKNWSETRLLADLLPKTFDWERASYDGEEVDKSLNIVFRDFDTEYLRPDYLLDAVWQITEEKTKGYIHLVGPGGMGKTFFVRGLAAEGPEQDAVVLSYHILPGALAVATTFLPELHAQARDKGLRTQEPQTHGMNTAAEMQAEFASYLSELKRAKRNVPLIVAIDALDELADPAEHSIGITDCLPPTDLLPDGCFFVLTSREELRPHISADIARLKAASPDDYISLTIGADNAANMGLLRAYLAKHLPAPFQTLEGLNAVLKRSIGVFLYAFHLCRALAAGVFPDVSSLPDGAQFYPAYLDRLHTRVGDHLYETVYLPILLLLCAAQQPVTLEQLARWGVPHDRLQFALLDLRDFLRVHRDLPWQDRLGEPDGENWYEMAHESFVRFLQADPHLAVRLRSAHGAIADAALLTHRGFWRELDPREAASLYDLRYVMVHLERGKLTEAIGALQADAQYASACWDAANMADKTRHLVIVIALLEAAIIIYHNVGNINRMADALMNKGNAIARCGRLAEALDCFDGAAAALQPLIMAGQDDAIDSLAFVLMNRGVALEISGRIDEAIKCHNDAIEIWRPRVKNGQNDIADRLARALTSKGVALGSSGHLNDALVCLDEATAIYQSLVQAGRDDLGGELAAALTNKGVSLDQLGRPDEALFCYTTAAEFYRPLVEAGRGDLAAQFARALSNKAKSFSSSGCFVEAINCFDSAVFVLRPLFKTGRDDLADQLAALLMSQGAALGASDRSDEALKCLDEATLIYRSLIQAGRNDIADRLARALTSKGVVLGSSGYLDDALICLDEATAIYQSLIQDGRNDLARAVASTLGMREMFAEN